jgi:F-type H+-transporting ATPase subunit delta
MSQARIEGYARALFEIARAEENVEQVATELTQAKSAFESSDALRTTLGDSFIPAEKRQAIVEDLLGGKASVTATQIVSMIVGAGRVSELPAIVDAFAKRAAHSASKEVAVVRTAIALTDDQKSRIAAALTKKAGTQIAPQFVVDSSVVGGVVATVGDDVIDVSVRKSIEDLKSRI